MPNPLTEPAQELRAALDAFTETLPEADRPLVAKRIGIQWRHIRLTSVTALLHGEFQLASRLYAACHAATRISVIIDQTNPDRNPDAAGAARKAQAAAGRLIREFEAIADELQYPSPISAASDEQRSLPCSDTTTRSRDSQYRPSA